MDRVVIDKDRLTRYERVLQSQEFPIKYLHSLSEEQRVVLQKMKDFLKKYIVEKQYPQKSIDEQNYVFAKIQIADVLKIFKSSASLTSKTIESYVSTALKELQLEDVLFSQANLDSLKSKATKAFQKALDEIDSFTPRSKQETSSDQRDKPAREGEQQRQDDLFKQWIKSPSQKTIDKYVKANLYLPKMRLDSIASFLSKNVFDNMGYSMRSNKFSFQSLESTLNVEAKKRRPGARLWNPTISQIASPFVWFERNFTYGVVDRTRKTVRRFKEKTYSLFNAIFPLSVVGGALKFGYKTAKFMFKFAKKTLSFAYGLVSKTLYFVWSTISFIGSTAYKVGRATTKFLYGSLSKLAKTKAMKLTVKTMLAFFSTYPGAYLLGFIVGRVYGRMKQLLDFVGGIYEEVKKKLLAAKNWFEKRVYDPYIAPIVKWLTGFGEKVENAGKFYFDLFEREICDPKDGFLKNIDDTARLFADFKTSSGESIFNVKSMFNELDEWVQAIQDFELIDLKRFAVVQGGRMLGGIAGSYIGAAIGQVAIPIPVVGAVIGSLLFGYGGDWLGKTIGEMIMKTSPIEGVAKEETAVESYIRKNFGVASSEYAESTFVAPSRAANIGLLKQIGQRADTDFDVGESRAAVALKERFGIDISSKLIGASAEKKASIREQLKLFSRIDDLSYDKIYSEINDTLKEMHSLMDSGNTKGFLEQSEVIAYGNLYNQTIVNLEGKPSRLYFPFMRGNDIGVNPYWAKIARDLVVLNNLRKLSANQIDPFKFLEIISWFSENRPYDDIGKFLREYAKGMTIPLTINAESHNYPIADLIYGTYFKDPKRYPEFTKSAKEDYPKVGGRAEALNSREVLGYFPIDSDWHFFTARSMEAVSFKNVLRSGASRYKSDALGDSFSTSFGKVQESILSEGRYATQDVDREATAFSIMQRLGEGARTKFGALSESEREALIKETIIDLASGADRGSFLGNAFSDKDATTAIFKDAMSKMKSIEEANALSSKDLKEELSKALSEAQTGKEEYALTLDGYSELAKISNDFLSSTLIPALEELVKKGADKKTLWGIFGLPYSADGVQNAAMDIVCEDASPNVQ